MKIIFFSFFKELCFFCRNIYMGDVMKKIILCIYFFLIIILGIIYLKLDNKESNYEVVANEFINVDLKGAVNNPGVKTIKYGTTIDELISNNGGLLENADTSMINLSKRLENEEVVIIYTIDEIKDNNAVKIIDKQCVCPEIKVNSCINNNSFTNVSDESGKIHLNSASKEELMTLKGIGESKADLIIEYRNNKLFSSIEEIMNIKGIGKSIFEKIKDNISL